MLKGKEWNSVSSDFYLGPEGQIQYIDTEKHKHPSEFISYVHIIVT